MGDVAGPVARRRRKRRVVIVLVVVLAAATAGAGWWWAGVARARAERAAAERLVAELAGAWEQRDLSGVPATVDGLAERFTAATAGLGDAEVAVAPGPVTIEDTLATTTLDVAWTLAGGSEWSYTTTVELLRTSADEPMWQVDWSPATVHPQLTAGVRLRAAREQPRRGDIVDANGDAIVTPRPVVHVFVQPSRVEDLGELTADLAELLDIDGADLGERVEAAGPEALVPVITLREDDYAAVEDELFPLPGAVFRRGDVPLAPTREFARAFLGSVGEVTAEQLKRHPERYERGDVIGHSGLQAALDERLRGTAGLTVEVVTDDEDDEAEDDGEGEEDDVRRVLHEVEAEDGRDVAITLRRRIQRAADAALAGIERPSALVAIDVPTADVVAVANGPGAGFDIATTGQYPPGSTFKVVTAARLLEDGLGPDDAVECPGTVTVDGRDFVNAEGAELGDVPFATAFAQSCNTAFVGLSRRLDAGALQATAEERFGIGTRGDLGTGAFAGQVPREDSDVEIAAAAIGQAQVLVSPLIAADLAATVARGSWLEPRLLLDPAADQRSGDDLPQAGVLQDLTRAVVTDGSGEAVGGVPGPDVHGKTGTAEYGDEDPPRTHAWFIGYQDDLAFAVLVAETADSFGGQVAAPIAAEFLTALRSS